MPENRSGGRIGNKPDKHGSNSRSVTRAKFLPGNFKHGPRRARRPRLPWSERSILDAFIKRRTRRDQTCARAFKSAPASREGLSSCSATNFCAASPPARSPCSASPTDGRLGAGPGSPTGHRHQRGGRRRQWRAPAAVRAGAREHATRRAAPALSTWSPTLATASRPRRALPTAQHRVQRHARGHRGEGQHHRHGRRAQIHAEPVSS